MFKGGMASMMQKAQKMQQEQLQAASQQMLAEAQQQAEIVENKVITEEEFKILQQDPIDKGLLNDKEMLEDLIMMAINDASSQVNRISEEKMKGVTGGLNLPF